MNISGNCDLKNKKRTKLHIKKEPYILKVEAMICVGVTESGTLSTPKVSSGLSSSISICSRRRCKSIAFVILVLILLLCEDSHSPVLAIVQNAK